MALSAQTLAPSVKPLPPKPNPRATAQAAARLTREELSDWVDALGAPEGFLAYAEVLQLAPRLPPPLSAAEKELDGALAFAVLEHSLMHQLGPNSYPSHSLRILNLVADPNADLGELTKLISQDAALSAAVLKVANSVHYRGVDETETVRDAVSRLGLTEVARIGGIVSARTLFNPKVKAEFASFGPRFNRLFHQSATTSMGASWLALQKGGARADRVFLAGMLHDVGKSIALRSLAALMVEKRLPCPLTEARTDRVVETVHVEIGAAAHEAWELPSHAVLTCKMHHDEGLGTSGDLVDLHVLRLASALHLLRSEPGRHPHGSIEVFESAQALGFDPLTVRTADTELKRLEDKATSLYGANVLR